jgi:hypothetical protein
MCQDLNFLADTPSKMNMNFSIVIDFKIKVMLFGYNDEPRFSIRTNRDKFFLSYPEFFRKY